MNFKTNPCRLAAASVLITYLPNIYLYVGTTEYRTV